MGNKEREVMRPRSWHDREGQQTIRGWIMDSMPPAKLPATVTIEPVGCRTTLPRNHLVRITIPLRSIEDKYADKNYIARIVRKSLAGFLPAVGEQDRREVIDLTVSNKSGKTRVTGVEGSVVWPKRPSDDSITILRAALLGEGYHVTVREKRECAQSSCSADAMVDWNRKSDVPSGWYSELICERHNHRTCSKCGSTYVLTSTNSAGQAPSVRCGVCGVVMVEWGSSKIWDAELVMRGTSLS